jgi:hypothetical protein
MYEQVKSLAKGKSKRTLKDNKVKKDKIKKMKVNIAMYEVADFDDAGREGVEMVTLVDEGVKQRKKELNMSIEERLKLKEAWSAVVSEAKILAQKGEGASREVAYVPMDVRRKMENAKTEKANTSSRGQKRNRRGIKELSFKTPFKSKM